MKIKYLQISFLSSMMVIAMGCSDSNPLNPLGDCGTGSWAEEVSAELSAFSAAADVYGNNPTVENCNAYKSAGEDYLDALELSRGCVVLGGQQAFDAAIDDAKADLAALDCSDS